MQRKQNGGIMQYLPGFIRKDFVRKLMAVILTAIIYAAVMDRLSTNHDVAGVPLAVKPPPGFVLMEDGIQSVKVTVAGSQSLLKRLKSSDFIVTGIEIDPDLYQEGKPYILNVRPENISSPIGIKVISVTPQSFRVDMDKVDTKDLPVEAVFDTKMPPPPGYAVNKVNVSPQYVRVTAPSMILEKLQVMKTEPISLDRMIQSFDVNTNVVVSRPDIKVSPGKVLVQTEIKREIEKAIFPGLPVRIMKGADNEDCAVDVLNGKTASVTVSAPSEILKRLTPSDIKVYVDISGLGNDGSHELRLGCWVTVNDVVVEQIHPETIKVRIK